MTKKNLGSVKDLKKQKPPFWKRFQDYKHYVLIVAVILLGGLFMFGIFRSMGRRVDSGENPTASPTAVAAETEIASDLGKLVIVTDPEQAAATFRGETVRTPATFNKIPEGEYILVVSRKDYRTSTETVKITRGETSRVEIKLEKL